FLRDVTTGRTIRVSQTPTGGDGNQESRGAVISGDGRFVVFPTGSSNLVPNDTNNAGDVFLYDVSAKTLELESVRTDGAQANDPSVGPAVSQDGGYVAFMSYATNLVSGDTNGVVDIFLRDRNAGTTTRVSVAADGTQADSDSVGTSMSADGRYVCFAS